MHVPSSLNTYKVEYGVTGIFYGSMFLADTLFRFHTFEPPFLFLG